ncbi:UDP-glucose 4-epimerase [Andreesenia angusta]|uniref:UDP-glucose 4-epimerase n=1 Tax=Andreesenia angusta TaxID=39480 RepID=A0A1S1V652_9FIRM|nr:UDP-glucose 4-epimerase GalE [Andreesenia angusta]OHW61895.1 UDP-glucose 4-epimerase [Andreesenia angusta]
MSILVTGGAGYIGSHTVKYLQHKGEDVVVVDNLQSGHRSSVDVESFYKADIRDRDSMDRIFQKHAVKEVVHFAANSIVGESMKDPYSYYHNNVYGTLCLLDSMKKNGVYNIVFSSSAAVYGEPDRIPIVESAKTIPTNAYGETKLVIENMMKWFEVAHGIKHVSLRYFNAAGAEGSIGEDHSPETHLIPILLQKLLGQREKVFLFGDDYETEDGTCIRDYVHVQDLSAAHYLSINYLRNTGKSDIFNLGNGRGYSVKEVLKSVERVTKATIDHEVKDRRVGDPDVLIASSEKAKSVLGWNPEFGDIEKIIGDAWTWHRKNPNGYKD